MRRLLFPAAVMALGLLALSLVVLFKQTGGDGRDFVGSAPPEGIALPSFSLRNYAGGVVRSEDLRGKVAVVTFLESRCEEACPIIASEIGRAMRLLTPAERERVVALAISTHPGDDTPASVRAFLRKQRAEGELSWAVGSEAELRPVWKSFSVLSALESGSAEVHSAPVRVFDPDGEWVSTLNAGVDLNALNLRHDVLEALR